jgi:hypothetical protein
VLHVLIANDVNYAVFYAGKFEAGIEPDSNGRLN